MATSDNKNSPKHHSPRGVRDDAGRCGAGQGGGGGGGSPSFAVAPAPSGARPSLRSICSSPWAGVGLECCLSYPTS